MSSGIGASDYLRQTAAKLSNEDHDLGKMPLDSE
jgi:hypothetical protein